MTVRVNSCRGDGTYYLRDPAHELDGLRAGPPGRVVVGPGDDPAGLLEAMLAGGRSPGPAAYDVIVAAPKTVSLLLALESDDVARQVVALHERAVDAAVSYLVDEALGGGDATPPVVGFTHGVNRQLDPHLHTHVLVGACDLRGRVVELAALRSHGAAADALYRGELRAGIAAAAGRVAWQTPWGRTLVEGVDYTLVAHTSAPRDRGGTVERVAAKPHPTRAEVSEHWRASLGRHEPSGLELTAPSASATIDEYRFARALGTGLVGRRDVVRAWADACTRGDDAAAVRAAVSLAAPLAGPVDRVAAVAVRDAPGVRFLGPRPRDPGSMEEWRRGREALDRYLGAGHRLSHALDPRGAPAATRLALATLDVSRATRARATPEELGRSRVAERSIS